MNVNFLTGKWDEIRKLNTCIFVLRSAYDNSYIDQHTDIQVVYVVFSAFTMPVGHQHGISLRFNGHFPGEPGLAGVYWSKGWWKWWWQLEIKVVQSSSQIITTNIPTFSFLQAGCPSCRPTNSVNAMKGKIHIPWTCLPQAQLGSSNVVTDH